MQQALMTSQATDYAARESAAPQLQGFEGGLLVEILLVLLIVYLVVTLMDRR